MNGRIDGSAADTMTRTDRILAAITLVAAVCQLGLGARYSPSGEQLGMAVPLSSVVLAMVVVVLVIRHRGRVVPLLSVWQTGFLAVSSLGLLGLTRQDVWGGVKEMVQLAEIVILAPWAFRALSQGASITFMRSLVGWAGLALLFLRPVPFLSNGVVSLSDAKYAAFILMAWPSVLSTIGQARGKLRFGLLAVSGSAVGLTFCHGGPLLAWFLVTALSAAGRKRLLTAIGALCCAAPAVLFSLLPLFHPVNPWQRLDPHYDGEHLKRSVIEARAAFRAPVESPLGAGLGRYKTTINQLRLLDTRVPHAGDERVPADGNCQYLVTMVEAGPAAALALIALFAGSAMVVRRRGADSVWALSLASCLLAGLFCVILSRGTGIWVGAVLGMAAHGAPPLPHRAAWRRAALVATAAGVCLVLTLCRAPAKPRIVVLDDSDGTGAPAGAIRVEAEDCSVVEAPFAVAQANDASGHRALVLPDDTAKGKGKALYSVDIREAGTYVLSARVLWKDGCGNSVRFEIGRESCVLADDVFGEWHTLQGKRVFSLSAGTTSVVIHNLEDGIHVDYWELRKAGVREGIRGGRE